MAEVKDTQVNWRIKHGGSRSREYEAWRQMLVRCQNPSSENYKYYGARGIRVCERWRRSFSNFREDMGQRPSDRYSLERKNVNGDYEPENCVWATNVEQMRNRRDTNYVVFHGERRKLVELCDEHKIQPGTARARIRRGYSIEEVFETAVEDNANLISYRGKLERLQVLCRRFGVYRNTVKRRIAKGWSVEKALETPVSPRKIRKDKKERNHSQLSISMH